MFVSSIVAIVLCLLSAPLTLGRREKVDKVSSQVKDQILSMDDADSAYALYLQSYDTGPAMLKFVDPETEQRENERKKNNFLQSLAKAKAHNIKFANGESRYKMTVNSFSVMDEEEKRARLGVINATRTSTTSSDESLRSQLSSHPESLSWHSMGYVTDSFDQADCGSCWTFPAVALLEFALKRATGKLIQLSNQQLLDCTYEFNRDYGRHNGCDGGLYEHAWDFVMSTQHLAPLAKYSYKEQDYTCDYERYSNALEGKVKLTGHIAIAATSSALISALQDMPLAVAIKVEDELYGYGGGVYDGCVNEHNDPDHAVLLTGYGPGYWEIRNSWGIDWGINGFMKFTRGRGSKMCFLLDFAAQITYKNLREGVTPVEKETTEALKTTNTGTTSSQPTSPTTEPPTDPPRDESTHSKPDTTTEDQDTRTVTKPVTTDNRVTTGTEELPTTQYREQCNPGFYWDGRNCLECEANTYSGHAAQFCLSCPEGTVSDAGSTSVEDCVEEQCTDSYGDCAKWARYGYCESGDRVSFMETECRRSCYFCTDYCEAGYNRDTTTGRCVICPRNTYSPYKSHRCEACPTGSSSPEGSTDVSQCERDTVCEDAAHPTWCLKQVQVGHCLNTNAQIRHFMERRCPKSCGFCSTEEVDPNECQDIYEVEYCQRLKDRGYCYTLKDMDTMREFCGRTCGTCREQGGGNNCVDDAKYAENCLTWTDYGYCEYGGQYTGFMHRHCRQSCHRDMNICSESERIVSTNTPTTTGGTDTTAPPGTEFSDATTTPPGGSDCWQPNAGIPMHSFVQRVDFTSYRGCLEVCKASPRCRGVMVSPRGQECYIMGDGGMERRVGWVAADRECFQPQHQDDEDQRDGGCADSEEYTQDCPVWADQRYGYCTSGSYVQFMEQNCRASCKLCVASCTDNPEHAGNCQEWQAKGFCNSFSYRKWMSENCAASCGSCDEEIVTGCADNTEHAADCGYWQEQGYCRSGQYVKFMRENCAKSCNMCRGNNGQSRGRKKGHNRKSRG